MYSLTQDNSSFEEVFDDLLLKHVTNTTELTGIHVELNNDTFHYIHYRRVSRPCYYCQAGIINAKILIIIFV
jgi:hypothetical protein